MLKQAGLTEGNDYQTALLDGFDPKIHIAIPEIIGFPGFKSNEPLQLAAAGIPFKLYDPADYGIPGSFGVLYTNSTFLGDFPTATEDFMRAAMKGLADALADPEAAANIAVDMINANGNALAPVGRRRDRPLGCRVEAGQQIDRQRPADRRARPERCCRTRSPPTPTSACSTARCPTSPRSSTHVGEEPLRRQRQR